MKPNLAHRWCAVCCNNAICTQVRLGRDDTALMTTLHDYLTDNDAVIRNYFMMADVNQNGVLEHGEIAALVSQIPGMDKDEQ